MRCLKVRWAAHYNRDILYQHPAVLSTQLTFMANPTLLNLCNYLVTKIARQHSVSHGHYPILVIVVFSGLRSQHTLIAAKHIHNKTIQTLTIANHSAMFSIFTPQDSGLAFRAFCLFLIRVSSALISLSTSSSSTPTVLPKKSPRLSPSRA